MGDRESVVGVATGGSEDQTPMPARFSVPVQTGPDAHPACCTMCAGCLPGPKRPGRGANHPLPSSNEVAILWVCTGMLWYELFLYRSE